MYTTIGIVGGKHGTCRGSPLISLFKSALNDSFADLLRAIERWHPLNVSRNSAMASFPTRPMTCPSAYCKRPKSLLQSAFEIWSPSRLGAVQHAAPLLLGPEPRGSAPVPELAGELQFRAVTPEPASAQL